MANAPPWERDGGSDADDLGEKESGIFLREGAGQGVGDLPGGLFGVHDMRIQSVIPGRDEVANPESVAAPGIWIPDSRCAASEMTKSG